MKRTKIIVFVLIASFLCGCQAIVGRKNQVGAAVEVYGHYLYHSTLDSLTLGLHGEDSLRVAQQYISQWAKDILMYEGAMRDVRDADVERLVADYRHSLYVHAYEEYLVEKRMSKVVLDTTVEELYNQMQDRFRLDESLVKGLLVIVPIDVPKIKDLRKWLSALTTTDDETEKNELMDRIEKYAYQNANGYELFVDKWLTTSELMIQIPIERKALEDLIKSQNQIEISDTLKTYILQISEKLNKGEQMPIEYARPEIEKIILSARQVEFLQRERERLYEEAVQNQNIIFYNK